MRDVGRAVATCERLGHALYSSARPRTAVHATINRSEEVGVDPVLKIRRADGTDDLPLPSYQTEHSAGLDLVAAVGEAVSIAPGETMLMRTP